MLSGIVNNQGGVELPKSNKEHTMDGLPSERRFGGPAFVGVSTGIAKVASALLASPWLAGLLAAQPSDRDPYVVACRRGLRREVGDLRDLLEHLLGAGSRLVREDAMTDLRRHLPLGLAAAGLAACAVLEAFAAYPAAAGLGLDLVVTSGIALVIVGAVVGLAALIAHSHGTRQRLYVGLAAVLLAVLWLARFRYAVAFGELSDAVASATGLTLVSLMVLVISHELWDRAEPVSRWQARRTVRRAERAVRRAVDRVRRTAHQLQRAEDGHLVQVRVEGS
jgi:hypothetical protein